LQRFRNCLIAKKNFVTSGSLTPIKINDRWIDRRSLFLFIILISFFFCSVFSNSHFAHTHTQQARIAADLIELRNKSVFAFLMFNALFVLIVFLLQLNKDQLHVIWPLGVKTNITYVEETSEVSDDQASNKGKELRRCHGGPIYIHIYGVSCKLSSMCPHLSTKTLRILFLTVILFYFLRFFKIWSN